MRLKIRTHQETLEEAEHTVAIIPVNDADIVSVGVILNHHRYYCLATLNKFTEWTYFDADLKTGDGLWFKKYEVRT